MNSDNYNQLRIDVEKQIGFRIKKISELKMAQEAIEWETKKKIGFNTLRRFFGFLKSTTPNSNTLNTLSVFVGYKNYSAYQKEYLRD